MVKNEEKGEIRPERHGYCHVRKEYFIFGVEASL